MKSLKSLINSAGIGSLRKMKKNELLEAAQVIRKALRSRRKTFQSHGAVQGIPEQYRSDLPSNDDFENRNDVLQWVNDALQYMREPDSTYRGYQKAVSDRMAAYNATLAKQGNKTFDSLEDFNRFGRFMGEAAERFYDFSVASDQVKEMYEQAERLGVDPNQFLKNYDYWAEHLDKLQDAEPISWNRTGKPVYASDYARQLHLPRMKDFYADMPRTTKKGRK